MNKLSIKLGLSFFIIFFGIIVFLLYFLHHSMVETQVEGEMSSLQLRGNSHRDVLEQTFNQDTIEHVLLMESASDTIAVISDGEGNILDSSDTVTPIMEDMIQNTNIETIMFSKEAFIETDFWESPFLATVSSFQNQEQPYFLFMFKTTENLRMLMHEMNQHFMYGAMISLVVTILVIYFLTNIITKPLLKMKQATERLSVGDFSVELPEFRDDELGKLSKAIHKLADDLKELTENRKEFLASISHELRTPLTYIKGYADVCRKGLISDKEKEKYLLVIFKEAERVSRLVHDLFELAKIDQNEFSIQRSKVSINDLVHNLYERFRPAVAEEGKKLDFEVHGEIWAFIDPIRIEQCLVNLLDNAKKYSLPNSIIGLEVYEKKRTIHIEVKNQSYPIDSRQLPRLFDRFYRIDSSRSRKLGGSGLGLSVVKEVIDAHGGTVFVSENEGIITVQLTLPGGSVL
ncbi:signal transduction histidine kinase [Bacillus oleivorans]|uniref:histidine kinase n=1 Tax=Bacillus oleivorans TaxID=1448271 RepID=A0A285D525_9BACI|nr:ATP-binding protein [Bacillus oleivorans]SNX74446.1 signal transduction histidine kinase [Bacillus oleivorans]